MLTPNLDAARNEWAEMTWDYSSKESIRIEAQQVVKEKQTVEECLNMLSRRQLVKLCRMFIETGTFGAPSLNAAKELVGIVFQEEDGQ